VLCTTYPFRKDAQTGSENQTLRGGAGVSKSLIEGIPLSYEGKITASAVIGLVYNHMRYEIDNDVMIVSMFRFGSSLLKCSENKS
jgi:hypothetical protein